MDTTNLVNEKTIFSDSKPEIMLQEDAVLSLMKNPENVDALIQYFAIKDIKQITALTQIVQGHDVLAILGVPVYAELESFLMLSPEDRKSFVFTLNPPIASDAVPLVKIPPSILAEDFSNEPEPADDRGDWVVVPPGAPAPEDAQGQLPDEPCGVIDPDLTEITQYPEQDTNTPDGSDEHYAMLSTVPMFNDDDEFPSQAFENGVSREDSISFVQSRDNSPSISADLLAPPPPLPVEPPAPEEPPAIIDIGFTWTTSHTVLAATTTVLVGAAIGIGIWGSIESDNDDDKSPSGHTPQPAPGSTTPATTIMPVTSTIDGNAPAATDAGVTGQSEQLPTSEEGQNLAPLPDEIPTQAPVAMNELATPAADVDAPVTTPADPVPMLPEDPCVADETTAIVATPSLPDEPCVAIVEVPAAITAPEAMLPEDPCTADEPAIVNVIPTVPGAIPVATLMMEFALQDLPGHAQAGSLDAAGLLPRLQGLVGQWISERNAGPAIQLADIVLVPQGAGAMTAYVSVDVYAMANAITTSPLTRGDVDDMLADLQHFCEAGNGESAFGLRLDLQGIDLVAGKIEAAVLRVAEPESDLEVMPIVRNDTDNPDLGEPTGNSDLTMPPVNDNNVGNAFEGGSVVAAPESTALELEEIPAGDTVESNPPDNTFLMADTAGAEIDMPGVIPDADSDGRDIDLEEMFITQRLRMDEMEGGSVEIIAAIDPAIGFRQESVYFNRAGSTYRMNLERTYIIDNDVINTYALNNQDMHIRIEYRYSEGNLIAQPFRGFPGMPAVEVPIVVDSTLTTVAKVVTGGAIAAGAVFGFWAAIDHDSLSDATGSGSNSPAAPGSTTPATTIMTGTSTIDGNSPAATDDGETGQSEQLPASEEGQNLAPLPDEIPTEAPVAINELATPAADLDAPVTTSADPAPMLPEDPCVADETTAIVATPSLPDEPCVAIVEVPAAITAPEAMLPEDTCTADAPAIVNVIPTVPGAIPVATLMMEFALQDLPGYAQAGSLDAAGLLPRLQGLVGQWISERNAGPAIHLADIVLMPQGAGAMTAYVSVDVYAMANAITTSPLTRGDVDDMLADLQHFCEAGNGESAFGLRLDLQGIDLVAGKIEAAVLRVAEPESDLEVMPIVLNDTDNPDLGETTGNSDLTMPPEIDNNVGNAFEGGSVVAAPESTALELEEIPAGDTVESNPPDNTILMADTAGADIDMPGLIPDANSDDSGIDLDVMMSNSRRTAEEIAMQITNPNGTIAQRLRTDEMEGGTVDYFVASNANAGARETGVYFIRAGSAERMTLERTFSVDGNVIESYVLNNSDVHFRVEYRYPPEGGGIPQPFRGFPGMPAVEVPVVVVDSTLTTVAKVVTAGAIAAGAVFGFWAAIDNDSLRDATGSGSNSPDAPASTAPEPAPVTVGVGESIVNVTAPDAPVDPVTAPVDSPVEPVNADLVLTVPVVSAPVVPAWYVEHVMPAAPAHAPLRYGNDEAAQVDWVYPIEFSAPPEAGDAAAIAARSSDHAAIGAMLAHWMDGIDPTFAACIFGYEIADFDGDGDMDLILLLTAKYDATLSDEAHAALQQEVQVYLTAPAGNTDDALLTVVGSPTGGWSV